MSTLVVCKWSSCSVRGSGMRTASATLSSGGVGRDSGSFFFSSRRRHTRYWRDWSSDVCSSDLELGEARGPGGHRLAVQFVNVRNLDIHTGIARRGMHVRLPGVLHNEGGGLPAEMRSEERRVGKECRSRWSPYH